MYPEKESDDDIVAPSKQSDDNVDANFVLDQLNLQNYDDVEKTLKQDIMTPQKSKAYLLKVIKNAMKERVRIGGYKANITKKNSKVEK